jgi:hypothetical protein
MKYSQANIQEFEKSIKSCIDILWSGLKSDHQEFLDVMSNVVTCILEALENDHSYNIFSLVRAEKRKYYKRINTLISLPEYLVDIASAAISDPIDFLLQLGIEEWSQTQLLNIWNIAPELMLSAKQSDIYSNYLQFVKKQGKRRGFESYYASIMGVSQAAISKDLSRAIEKLKLSSLLIPDIFDLNKLLNAFGCDWTTSPLRQRLWPLLKPGKKRNTALAKLLKPYQNLLFDYSANSLSSFSINPDSSSKAFYQGYNALILGTYIDPDNVSSASFELIKNVAPKSWLAGRAVARQSHLLYDKEKWQEYRDWLLDLYFKDTMMDEKERYIGYMVSYFGGYKKDEAEGFVTSKAKFIPKKYDVEKLIREHYQNISDSLYTRSPILMEINFMRIALILSTIEQFDFSPSIINCISQILRRTNSVSDHSKVNLIISSFEKKIKCAERY